MSQGLDYLLSVLAERGLTPCVPADGPPSLKGPADQVTPALREALAAFRDELIERLREPPAAPAPEVPGPEAQPSAWKAREWLWRDGHTCVEAPDDPWKWGNPERHPTGAWWWRYHGGAGWRVIEERAHVSELGAEALHRGEGLPPGERLLERGLPVVPARPAPADAPVDRVEREQGPAAPGVLVGLLRESGPYGSGA